MKTKNTHDNNTSSFGKIAVLVLVLLFVTINHFRSQKDIVTKEEIAAQKNESAIQKRNLRNQFSDKTEARHIEKLKFAYTGKWAKNEVKDVNGEYSFTVPTNTRSQIKPTSMKKENKKKKKVAAKKTKKKINKIAKKSKRSSFHNNYDDSYDDGFNAANYPYANNPYYAQPNPQERAPSDDEKEKQLSPQEWLERITKSNSVSELTAAYKAGKVGQNLFFTVADTLISSDSENLKKLGFQAFAEVPSLTSFTKIAKHLNDQMSPQLKTFAQSTLEAYEQPNQLRILNSALNGKDTELRILAANIIKTVATSIVQAQASSGENVVYSEAQLKLYKTLLTQSLNVINIALETGAEATVVASFNSTRAILVQFLS